MSEPEIDRIEIVEEWLNALMFEIPERLCDLVRELRGVVVLLAESVTLTATHMARVLADLKRVEEQIGYLEKVMYRLCDESNKAQLIGPVLRALHGDASAVGEDGEGYPPQPDPSSSDGGGVTDGGEG